MRFRGFILLLHALVAPAAPALAQQGSPPAGLGEALARAQPAYAVSDWVALREALTAAESFTPAQPLVLYHLARAEALTGNPEGAGAPRRSVVLRLPLADACGGR